MSKKHKNKGMKSLTPRCPYCGSTTVLRSADGIYHDNSRHVMLYVCKNYPKCDCYVRVKPGTFAPMGIPANRQLRQLRTQTHMVFDRLYNTGIMSKRNAYRWLADYMCCPLSEAHIGLMGEYYCHQVIRESQKILDTYQRQHRKDPKVKQEGGRAS